MTRERPDWYDDPDYDRDGKLLPDLEPAFKTCGCGYTSVDGKLVRVKCREHGESK